MITEAAQRKLTTILAADVVGYSRLMAADEEATLAILRTYLSVTNAIVARHGGRIFSTAGDAFLAEFGSPVEAVRCAVAMQEDLAVRNAEVPADRQMWFRVGINVGDVMVENGDLFGDGVNIAARLEAIAERGGICISGSTFELVKNKLSIAFQDLGPQSVKNIPEPVPAFQLVPGPVSTAEPARSDAGFAKGRSHRLMAWTTAACFAVVAVAATAHFTGLYRIGATTAHPFDGRWTVTVDTLSGCLNNSRRSYQILVETGRIDHSELRFPKGGSVSRDGTFEIISTNRNGIHQSTQSGLLSGDSGTGTFVGSNPACTGKVTLTRIAS